MKLYALFITCPLALLIQHLYSEIIISFEKIKARFICIVIILAGICYFVTNYLNFFSRQVRIEVLATVILAILGAVFIGKFEKKKSIECFEAYEKIVIYPQIVIGFFFCLVPFSNLYEKYAVVVCNQSEIILSRMIYILLGISYIFFNRFFFYFIYIRFIQKK